MKELFPIIPPGNAMYWFVVPIILIIAALLFLLLTIGFSTRKGLVEVSAQGLKIQVPFYGRILPLSSLILEEARPADLKTEKDLRLAWRTNGIGLPGYSAGWFKLKNGEKALAAVTDPRKVAFIPTREGYAVLVSIEEPVLLVEALKRYAVDSIK